jgi:hypothetical protein
MQKAPGLLATYVAPAGKLSKVRLISIVAALGLSGAAIDSLIDLVTDDLEEIEPGLSNVVFSTLREIPGSQGQLTDTTTKAEEVAHSVVLVDLLCRNFGGFDNALDVVRTLREVTPQDFADYATMRKQN